MSGLPAYRSNSTKLTADEREALDRLMRVNGPGGLKAALLALLLLPGHAGRHEVWRDETRQLAEAETVLQDVQTLQRGARLPWFERVLQRLAGLALPDRQALLRTARRLLTAPGGAHPLDRLHWLALRREFGESAWGAPRTPLDDDDAGALNGADLHSLARYTGFLSRLVPNDDPASEAGPRWYRAVMAQWQSGGELLPLHRPDVDEMVQALRALQALSWNQRPVLVRVWFAQALVHSRGGVLAPCAADALRLSCTLLDSPVPPELARHYIAITQER